MTFWADLFTHVIVKGFWHECGFHIPQLWQTLPCFPTHTVFWRHAVSRGGPVRGSGTDWHRALLTAVLSTAFRPSPAGCPSTSGSVETTGRLMQKPTGSFLFLLIEVLLVLG